MDGDPAKISIEEMDILTHIQTLNEDKDLISAVIAGTYLSYPTMTESLLDDLFALSEQIRALTKY